MVTAANNVQAAKEELVEAEQHQKKGGKCLLYLVITSIILIAIILGLVFGLKKN